MDASVWTNTDGSIMKDVYEFMQNIVGILPFVDTEAQQYLYDADSPMSPKQISLTDCCSHFRILIATLTLPSTPLPSLFCVLICAVGRKFSATYLSYGFDPRFPAVNNTRPNLRAALAFDAAYVVAIGLDEVMEARFLYSSREYY
jgi:hypothetical protein